MERSYEKNGNQVIENKMRFCLFETSLGENDDFIGDRWKKMGEKKSVLSIQQMRIASLLFSRIFCPG